MLDWFGSLGALILEAQNLRPPVVIIPIPSSDQVSRGPCSPASRTFWLANAIVTRSKRLAVVSDVLSWNREQKPSHRGGSRDAGTLCQQLLLSLPVPEGTVVLVDDVLTTGGHLLAAASRLAAVGIHCQQAICFARSGRTHSGVFGVEHLHI